MPGGRQTSIGCGLCGIVELLQEAHRHIRIQQGIRMSSFSSPINNAAKWVEIKALAPASEAAEAAAEIHIYGNIGDR